MSREAMQLALEALELYQSRMCVQMFDEAITALRQAARTQWECSVNNTTISGFMYSYIGRDGKERMLSASFGQSRTKAKRYFNAQNALQRLEPVQPHKLYEVTISVGSEVMRERNGGAA
jgi:hypothetical protein